MAVPAGPPIFIIVLYFIIVLHFAGRRYEP